MKSVRISALMLVFAMLTACFVGGTFAKYAVEADANVSQTVQAFGWTVEATETAVSGNLYPGASESITFTVDKEDDALAATLAAELNVTAEPANAAGTYKPVVFTLTKDGVAKIEDKTSAELVAAVAAITAEEGTYVISWEWPLVDDATTNAKDMEVGENGGSLTFDITFGIEQANA